MTTIANKPIYSPFIFDTEIMNVASRISQMKAETIDCASDLYET